MNIKEIEEMLEVLQNEVKALKEEMPGNSITRPSYHLVNAYKQKMKADMEFIIEMHTYLYNASKKDIIFVIPDEDEKSKIQTFINSITRVSENGYVEKNCTNIFQSIKKTSRNYAETEASCTFIEIKVPDEFPTCIQLTDMDNTKTTALLNGGMATTMNLWKFLTAFIEGGNK